ncbi:unnamed protein product [Lampetra planeri]
MPAAVVRAWGGTSQLVLRVGSPGSHVEPTRVDLRCRAQRTSTRWSGAHGNLAPLLGGAARRRVLRCYASEETSSAREHRGGESRRGSEGGVGGPRTQRGAAGSAGSEHSEQRLGRRCEPRAVAPTRGTARPPHAGFGGRERGIDWWRLDLANEKVD